MRVASLTPSVVPVPVVPVPEVRESAMAGGRAHRPALRWMLLGVVLIGALAMHLVSRHHVAGPHQPIAAVAAATDGSSPAQGLIWTPDILSGTTAGDAGAPADELVVVGCALLLLLAGAMGATRWRAAVDRLRTTLRVRSGAVRAPPMLLSRMALCVARI